MAPKQKPGKSEQVVGTPREFLTAVVKRFGDIVVDLAAVRVNAAANVWLGPGGVVEDALGEGVDWRTWALGASPYSMWLNPPFRDIAPWARRSAMFGVWGCPIRMLVPASVGTDWWLESVHNKAYVFALKPRLQFVGHDDPYPKDLALCVWNPPPVGEILRPYNVWDWKRDVVW